MKLLLIPMMFLLTSCAKQTLSEHLVDKSVEVITGKDYSRDAKQCLRIKQTCPHEDFAEWIQENGQPACACNYR